MPALKNPRHERFAQEFSRGDKTCQQALVAAGFRPSAPNASRLANRPLVAARIKELATISAKRSDITRERIMTELARVAFSDLKEFATWNESGVSWKPDSALTEEQSRAIASIKQSMNEYGGTTELKLFDKLRALELLGKEIGMFVDHSKHEHTGKDGQPLQPIHVQVAAMSMPELMDRAAEYILRNRPQALKAKT